MPPVETTPSPATVQTPATPEPAAAPETPQVDAPGGDDNHDVLASIMQQINAPEPEKPAATDEPKPGEPEKKEEPKAGDEEPVPKNLTPLAEAKWKELKSETKQRAAKIAELEARLSEYEPKIQEREAKIKELEGKTAALADLDRMKERLDEAYSELAVSRIEATPEFKRSVIEPMAAIHARVEKMTAKYEGVDKNTILRALSETDEDKQADLIAAFASEWKEKDRVDLYTLGNDYVRLSERRDSMKQNAADALKQIQDREAKDQEATAAETKAEWSRASIKAWEQTIAPIFKDMPEEEAVRIKGSVANLDFSKESVNGRAFAAYSAMLLPRVVKDLSTATGKVKELEAKIASLQKASPGGGHGDKVETKKTDVTDDRPFLDVVMAGMK